MCDFLSCNLTQGINTFTCSSGQITGRYVFVEGQKCSGVSFKMYITEVKVCGVCKVLETANVTQTAISSDYYRLTRY